MRNCRSLAVVDNEWQLDATYDCFRHLLSLIDEGSLQFVKELYIMFLIVSMNLLFFRNVAFRRSFSSELSLCIDEVSNRWFCNKSLFWTAILE